ncbi:MAG: TonB-dependent receptor [Pseudomonadota bacterium]
MAQDQNILGHCLDEPINVQSDGTIPRNASLTSRVSTSILAVCAGLILPTLATAQTESNTVDDVVVLDPVLVTARRVTENLQDVPLTIQVINAAEIARANVQNTEDVARLTAGLTYDIGGFPNDTRPGVRGMQAERGRPSVAVMLDGIDLSGENLAIAGGTAGIVTSLFDLERIEVVKGPQSTLYGRNAFAGAINYISKKPEFDYAASGTVEVAEGNTLETFGSLTGPLIEDKLAVRLNLASRSTDGRYEHPVNGDDLGAEDFSGGALALRATPLKGLDVTARIQVSETDQSDLPTAFLFSNERVPVPGGTFTAGPPGTPPSPCPDRLTGAPPPLVTACTRGTYTGRVEASIDDVQMGLNPLTGNPPLGMEVDQTVGSIDARWDTDFGEFRYLFGYHQNESFIETDGDFTDFPGPSGFVFSLSALQQLHYENEHTDHTALWLHEFDGVDVLLGAQVFNEDSTLLNDSKFWLRNPASPLAGPPFFLANMAEVNAFPAFYTRDTEYQALFGRVRWNVSDTIRLGLEARQNEDEITYTLPGWRLQDTSLSRLTPVCLPSLPQGATFMGVPGPDVPPPGTVVACPRKETVSFSEFTPRVTLDWQATDDALVYGSIARGYKPGGFNVNEINEFDGQGYLPEFVTAYEFGIKSAWLNRRLIVNADVYLNDYTDQQIGVQRNQVGSGGSVLAVPGILNAAAVETKGFELDADWWFENDLRLTLGYAYTDATFETYVQGPPPGAATVDFAACGVAEGQTSSPQFRAEAGNVCADFSGNAVPKSPEHALNLTAFYSRSFGPRGDRWFVEAGGRYRSKRFVDEANLSWTPAYTILDVTAGIEVDRVTLMAFVRNLSDEDSIQSAQRQVDPGNPEGFAPGRAIVAYLPEPRTFGLRATIAFE